MKLWHLYPIKDEEGPWESPYDKSHGFVISALSPNRARKIAQEYSGDEKRWGEVWLNPKITKCKELKPFNIEKMIIEDRMSA